MQDACAICGGPVVFRFAVPCDYRKPDVPRQFNVFWCNDCSYGMVLERLSRTEIDGFYDIPDYYTHRTAEERAVGGSRSFIGRLRQHLAWRLDHGTDLSPGEAQQYCARPHPTLLEIGCGNGVKLSAFEQSGFSVCGIEPDFRARGVALSRVTSVYEGTAETVPEQLRGKRFQVVLMSHVLEHCLDVNQAMANARNMLADDGILIVETPNCGALGFRLYGGEWPWSDIPRHLNFFSRRSLRRLLESHRLSVAAVRFTGFYRQFSEEWLETEEQIASAFALHHRSMSKLPNVRVRAWRLLLRSLVAGKDSKYDSVRLTAVRRQERTAG